MNYWDYSKINASHVWFFLRYAEFKYVDKWQQEKTKVTDGISKEKES